MSVEDQIRAIAATKPGFYDSSTARRQLAARPNLGPRRAMPRPGSVKPPTISSVPSSGGGNGVSPGVSPEAFQRIINGTPNVVDRGGDDGGGFLDTLGGIAKGAATGAIRLVDSARAASQTYGGEVGDFLSNFGVLSNPVTNTLLGNPFQFRGAPDENGERDQSFDLGKVLRAPFDEESMSTGFLERSPWTDELPELAKPVVGFAGDILSDPTTYLTGGTVKAGSVIGKAGVGASRKVLATDLAEAFAEKVGKGKLAKEVEDKVIQKAFTHGRGALTPQSLKKIGVTPQELAEYGIKADFGYTTGIGARRLNVVGSKRVAEASENVKGAVKAAFGRRKGSKMVGDIFQSNDFSYKELVREGLSGGANAATAARTLALINLGRAESRDWATSTLSRTAQLPGFAKLSDDQAKALTHALEIGDMAHPLVKEVSELYDEMFTKLQERGASVKYWQNAEGGLRYVPHRLSKEARKALETGDQAVKDVWDATTKRSEEVFQRARGTDSSIADINARWRASGHGYDLLEDNAHDLLTQYIQEGQEAVMRGKLTGDQARKFGFVDDLDARVGGSQAENFLAKAADAERVALERAAKNRRNQLKKAVKEARNERAVAKQNIDNANKLAAGTEAKAKDAARKVQLAEEGVRNARAALDANVRVMNQAVGKAKVAATRKVRLAESSLAKAEEDVAFFTKRFENAQKDFGRHADELAQAEKAFATLDEAYKETVAKRAALDADPLTAEPTDMLTEAAETLDAQMAAKITEEALFSAQGAENVASNTAAWVRAGADMQADRLSKQIDALTTLIDTKAGRMPGKRKGNDELVAWTADLSGRITAIRDLLRSSDNKAWSAIDKLEIQALDAEAEALKQSWRQHQVGTALKKSREARDAGSQIDLGVEMLRNTKFQDLIIESTRDGWEVLKRAGLDDAQINSEYNAAILKMEQFASEKTRDAAFEALHQAMSGYKKSLNWWKGWAVSSPGFLVRNLYSGMFNMYLDDVPVAAANTFFRFYRKTAAMSDQEALAWATKNGYAADQAQNLVSARKAAAATGSGQTQAEFQSLQGGASWNPLNPNNKVVSTFRKGGENVEAALRGGHAYGIIERGGSLNEAIQRVEKFQFNYTDIGAVDRVAKNVMPFWTFWSRNIGLQAQVFARRPDKINRSYVNAKRNIESMEGTDFGTTVPGYITGSMAGIATPFDRIPGFSSGQAFITPDIPSVRFPSQIDELVSNPVGEIGSSLAPWIKAPAQALMNKDLFTGREYRNSLTTFDDTGEVGRRAPAWAQVPGLDRMLGMLPGAEYANGDLYMQDNTEAVLNQINPVLGRVAGFLPNTNRGQEQLGQKVGSFVGLPIRVNDEGSIAGAEYGLKKEQEARMRAIEEKLNFNRIVGG